MKTTIRFPDELYRRAKATASLRRRKRKHPVEVGLRAVLGAPDKGHRQRSLAKLTKHARGTVESGVPDLASNARYLKGFGRATGDSSEKIVLSERDSKRVLKRLENPPKPAASLRAAARRRARRKYRLGQEPR